MGNRATCVYTFPYLFKAKKAELEHLYCHVLFLQSLYPQFVVINFTFVAVLVSKALEVASPSVVD
jgi:hypothetical protein